MRVEEHTLTLDRSPVLYRAAPSAGVPTVYLHGVPTSSADWVSLLERTGGIAPDLIGFGRSGKGGHLDYSIPGLANFVERLLDHLGLDEINLVGHDWGAAVASAIATRRGGALKRLVLIDAAPPLEHEEWHRLARAWRRRGVGELLMGSLPRFLLARLLRGASASPDAWPDSRLEPVWEQFDQGTQRATLRLHRSVDRAAQEQIAAWLGAIEIPSLVLWGERDPWYPAALADAWAGRLAAGRLERIPEAGHWPWLEEPSVIDTVAAFLAGP